MKRFEKQKLVLVALVVLLGMSMLGGCGKKHKTQETQETQAPVVEAALGEELLKVIENPTEEEISEEELSEELEENLEEEDIMHRPDRKVRGIYVTGPIAGTEKMEQLMELVESTALNTIVLDIKNDEGIISYHLDYEEAEEMGACVRYVSDMQGLLKTLHEKGIYVIGRIVCFKDPVLAAGRPELALCKPDGKPVTDSYGLAWVNPYKQEVWEYLCNIARSATLDGFDEIQFDYVRFPIGNDANAADYGVDMETYTRQMGLTDFFLYMEENLHEAGIFYGADLFGTVIGSDVDRDRTGQDYLEIAGLCDNICPMVYPSHYNPGTFGLDVPDAHPYETVYGAMSKSVEVMKEAGMEEHALVRPWLQCFTASWVSGHIDYHAKQIREQIQAVYDAGYDEWILWSAAINYEQVPEALEGLEIED